MQKLMQKNSKKKMLRGVSLFSSAGIGEAFFNEIGIEIVVANELLADRANLYTKLYPNTKMIQGDIQDKKVFNNILDAAGTDIDLLLATPPCQGMSVAGKNRTLDTMRDDQRNHLIFTIIDFINKKKPNYILIENVPNILKIKLPFKNKLLTFTEILSELYQDEYIIEAKVLDAANYGIPQRRKRALIKMYKQGSNWLWPKEGEKPITVKEAIGHLPSLESGEKSTIPWHFARKHSQEHITWLRHTPTGHSAFENKIHYPKKPNGEKIKSYMTTYRRINWDEPAPTITIRNDAISSQLNVHPGRKIKAGVFSDARVLTPLELMVLTSLPEKWHLPSNSSELLIRQCLGEGVPPLLLKKILLNLN